MREMILKTNRAFTLVELMIVVAIVILLVALSINGLMRSRITANEAAAIKTLRTYHTAFASFRTVNPGYPWELEELSSEYSNPPYIDNALARSNAIRQGYEFFISEVEGDYFQIVAWPQRSGVTGNRIFVIDQSGVMMEAVGGVATGGSQTLTFDNLQPVQ